MGRMHALETIEFDAVLTLLAGHCDTPGGEALALALSPRFDDTGVWFEIERTAEACALLDKSPVSLAGVKQLEDAIKRAAKKGTIDGASLWQVGESLRVMRSARTILQRQSTELPKLWLLGQRLADVAKLEHRLLNSLDGDGTVRDEASPELKAARQKKLATERRITERINSYVSGKSRDLLSDAVVTQRSGRYVIPLKAENKGKIKGIVHDTSASGQTVFVEPEDVVALGNELREAEAKERTEEQRVLTELSEEVGAVAEEVLDGLDAVTELDLVLAKARFGQQNHACIPTKEATAYLNLKRAWHPMIPRDKAVPLDIAIGKEHDCILITGPNTGGKTIAIKTVGLAVVMAQSGMMPFAQSMKLGVFTQVWADIGDEQSLQQSLSTFSGHIKNIAEAIRGIRKGALVLLDEIGAGTDPDEGAALARALLLKFQSNGARVIASTHYGELKIFASNATGFTNAAMEFDAKTLRPTYQFHLGVPGSSQAFRVAERHGVPRDVIEEALKGVRDEELDVARMIEKLERAQKQAQSAQSEADRLSARVRQLESEAEEKIKRADEARQRASSDAAEELSEVLAEIREEADEIFASLKPGAVQRDIEDARSRLKALQTKGQEAGTKLKPKLQKREAPTQALTKGTQVRIASLGQKGTVLDDPKDGAVNVQVGAIKMKVKLTDLEYVGEPATTKPKSSQSKAQLQRGLNSTREIHLRQMRAEDAIEELERFLDESVLAGVPWVRIVHGKGEGILRKITRELLQRHPHVKRFHDADPEQGGQGATIAEFE
jgi:DNA mismatch repair protein MutS2